MAGPLVFWPNRKSRNGLRRLSRVPRRLYRPTWFTTPPIAKEDAVSEEVNNLLIQVFNCVASSVGEPAETGLIVTDGVVLCQRILKMMPKLLVQRRDILTREVEYADKEIAVAEAELAAQQAKQRQLVAESEREEIAAERDDIAAKLSALRKEVDPEAIQLRIMYAADEATTAKQRELAEARSEIATLKSEVEELKRGKKRLREALDRLAKNT